MSTTPNDKLAVVRKSLAALKPPSVQDRKRWYMWKFDRMSVDEIANRCKVKPKVVQQSIDKMDGWKAIMSGENIGIELNAVVMEHIGAVSGVLAESLKAEHVVKRTNEEGVEEIVSRSPDHKTRHEAVDRIMKIADRNLPKGGGVQIAVQQNNKEVKVAPARLSFEEVLRQRRQARGLGNGESIEDPPPQDAEYVDADDEDEEDEDGEEE